MKLNIIGFLFLFAFFSCETKTDVIDCHISNVNNTLEIKFEEGNAKSFSFSPFEKNKVFIAFKESNNSFLEYNLLDKSFQPLDKKNYKSRFPSNAPIYIDQKDTSIWIGGNYDLKKVSTLTEKVTAFPIKQVTRIIPYNSKIYFASKKGFYKWDKKKQSHKKIDLPLRNFPSTQLLDERTLVFGNNFTYDLENDTWKKGVLVYNHTSKEDPRNFKMAKGIAAFPYGKDKTTLVFPDETRLVGIGNKPRSLNFQLPFIWKNSHKAIIRYDIEKNRLDTFRFTFPLALSRKNPFKFINKKTNTWIFKKGQLYFINTLTGEKYNYKFDSDENFISMKVDDCNVFLLFENKLIVKHKEAFIQECQPYDDKRYLAQLKEFRDFRNATKISKDTEEIEVLKKLGIIKSKYKNIDHPDIQRELDLLNTNAFNSVKYETATQLEACIKNKNIPVEKRKRCYQNLIYKQVRGAHFEKAIQLEKDFFATVDSASFSGEYDYYTNIDSVKNYLSEVDRLEKQNLAPDSLAFQKAIALQNVCSTPFFCHEGCGGCDFVLVTDALNNFIKNYPNSELRDNAEFDLLSYHYMYGEDIYDENFFSDYDRFIEEYPNSDLVDDAQFRIADFILQYIEYVQEDKTDFIIRLEKIAKEYPENDQTKWINKTLERLDKLK